MKTLISCRYSVLFALCAALLLGCAGTAPIRNVQDSSVTETVEDQPTSTRQVRRAIISAGGDLGWEISGAGRGHLIGTLFIRSHMAQVDIFFNSERYDIVYRNSSNLNYDPATGEIHPRYNVWVNNLDNAIQNRLRAGVI
ncbi:MAG: hypothetical protein ACFCBW_10910 [Candidatus Competibacterales bacterium]